MARFPNRLVRSVTVTAAAIGAAILLAGCGDSRVQELLPPDPATTQGQATRGIFDIVMVIGLAIFVLVEGLIVFAIIRYRRRRTDQGLPPQIHGNNRLEIAWTAIPVAIVLSLFVISWQALNTVDASQPDPSLRVGVVAFQWQWQFIYPGPGISWQDCSAPQNKGKCVTVQGLPPVNNNRANWQPPTLVLPVGETVELDLHSLDVIHSFYVPAFLFQRDITPGRDQTIQLTADKVGVYRGQCTQFCGLLHQQMEFQVQVVSATDYAAWFQSKLAPPSASPAPSGGASATPAGGGPSSPAASPAASPTAAPSASPSQ